ncbi:hypothetical protein SAMN05421779_104413 [Insolitispirillum peregrinum]|uniref:Yip1 domain-containing protein n=1 Tax=Insolitispirillum peregrinum TaxID=80876 RepID=A0A1N7MX81_9PROT|nr:hypothetical protein SAMN05421779_104413 [Insolitispirillum peregrinum]
MCVVSKDPSLPVGSPNPVQETVAAVLGVGELAFDRAGAFNRFVLTSGAYWRVFILSQAVVPAAIAAHLANLLEHPVLRMMVGAILPSMAAAAAASLATIALTAFWHGKRLQRKLSLEDVGPNALPFLVPAMWAELMKTVLLLLLEGIGSPAARLLQLAVLVTVLLAQWRAARVGLGLSGWQSAGMVAAFFGVQAMTVVAVTMIMMMLKGAM